MEKQKRKKNICIGLLAHVDAGKTTLSEQLLFKTGAIKKAGRVDHKDTFLDTHSLERERGITIFSKQAIFSVENFKVTLLDTPGHVDFSGEAERTLQVLDYGILIINGTDGVQSHTRTLWRLLKKYQIPVFLFINKMDQTEKEKEELLREIKEKLSDDCADFTLEDDSFYEEISLREEHLLEEFLEGTYATTDQIADLIKERKVFPCYFGSALKDQGIDLLLKGINGFMKEAEYKEDFAARVYKIGRDPQGQRLTYLKVTGGSLKVKQIIRQAGRKEGEEVQEKVNQLRFYSGISYETREEAYPGEIAAVTGLENTYPGQGLGSEEKSREILLEPVLTYSILLPEGVNVFQAFEKLKLLEEEEPNLQITGKEDGTHIQCKVMGEIQLQVIKELAKQRLGLEISFGSGQIVYKETIEEMVEGVGHFEPLRHYAEVHLLLKPLPRGRGIEISRQCSEDLLDRNWQRLILTHMAEREHRGVLTGSSITDMELVLVSGKAHKKHTEGGDFRQATYRAIRQGLCKAKSRLLEPVYDFVLEVPTATLGRAMSDLQRMSAEFQLEGQEVRQGEECSLIKGRCPVVTMQEYQKEVLSYTKGKGRLECFMAGYDFCHNEEEIIETVGYNPEADLKNPCGSIFCSHGAGVYVEWNKVEEEMHLPLYQEEKTIEQVTFTQRKREKKEEFVGTEEIDAILEKTFYSNRKKEGNYGKPGWKERAKSTGISAREYQYKGEAKKEEYLLVDGYNIIFAWQELKELAAVNLDGARGRLQDILSDYAGMRGIRLMVVFDAYRLQGHPVEVLDYHNIKVVFTKEAETADQFIEKFTAKHAKEFRITVATSDGLEQIIIRGQGCHLLSARELGEEIKRKKAEFTAYYEEKSGNKKVYLKELLPQDFLPLDE